MGDFYPGTEEEPSDFNPLRHPLDRKQAKVTDTYDPNNPAEAQLKEQNRIDKERGVPNTDNKRNEVAPDNVQKLKD